MRRLLALSALLLVCHAGSASDDCRHRGDLDPSYCDADNDLVADAPKDAAALKNPDTLIFSGTPEDSTLYQTLLQPFVQYLAQCTDKKVNFISVKSNAEEIELMREGKIHIGSFSTGPTGYAVNVAGAVPFAVRGKGSKSWGYSMLVIVRRDSKFKKIADLKGTVIAHTSASSNSGNLVPRALLPRLGLVPDKDYTVFYSGRHDNSIMAVKAGDVDAAAVASDVLHRLVERGDVDENTFRVLYTSVRFPSETIVHAHNLEPGLRDKIRQCFYDYRFTGEMQRAFDGADRFLEVTYKKDWDIVRLVATTAGQRFDRTWYQKELRREQDKQRETFR